MALEGLTVTIDAGMSTASQIIIWSSAGSWRKSVNAVLAMVGIEAVGDDYYGKNSVKLLVDLIQC